VAQVVEAPVATVVAELRRLLPDEQLFPTAGRCLELFRRRGRSIGW
jgi:hypothetical protein